MDQFSLTHTQNLFKNRIGFDGRDCSQMGLIRNIETSWSTDGTAAWIEVHCLQSGRKYTVRFPGEQANEIYVCSPGVLSFEELQEHLDGFREHVDEAIDFFGREADFVSELQQEYQSFIDDLVVIMEANQIYSPFHLDLLIARHYLRQMK